MSCSVCLNEFKLEPVEKQPYTLPCTHSFHFDCIKESAKECGQSCPNCRQKYKDMASEAKLNMQLAGKIEKNENEQIQIFIKDFDGKSTAMFVNPTDSEKKFHAMVSAMSGISIAELRLTTGTKNINAEGVRMLHELNIHKHSSVTILLRLKGGIHCIL